MPAASRVVVPVLVALFLWALVEIVLVPVETGDAYPRYSSLRADPLGSKILFDALRETPGLLVQRNFKAAPDLTGEPLFLQLGVSGPAWFSQDLPHLRQLESIANSGAKIVIGFEPALPALEANFEAIERMRSRPPGTKEPTAEPAKPIRPLVETRWGVKFRLLRVRPSRRARMERLPKESALYFEPDATWRVIERSPAGNPTTIEKTMGKGTVVLMAHTYRLSNEGLRDKPDPAWLSSFIGPHARIVFDEFHLGIAETGSVGSMIGRYRLQGAVAVLLVLGLLFIWRNATSLLPPAAAAHAAHAAPLRGRDAAQGLATLFRRNISSRDILNVCMAEWKKSLPLRAPHSAARIAAAEAVAAESPAPNPAEAYRRIQRILTDRT